MSPENDKCFNDRMKGIVFTVIGSFFSASASVTIKLAEEVNIFRTLAHLEFLGPKICIPELVTRLAPHHCLTPIGGLAVN